MRRAVLVERHSDAGGRLGRHVEHDPRSRSFAVARRGERRDVLHKRRAPIYDQGRYYDRKTKTFLSLGSCTGNALAGALSTEPFRHDFREATAVRIYSLGTKLDGFPGGYPPDDTGSSGLAVCKAAVQMGYLREYRHAFSVDDAIDALMLGPIIVGSSWLEAFDRPDSSGRVQLGGASRGGHEFLVRGWREDTRELFADNSWSPGWGPLLGSFRIPADVFAWMLGDDGDATIPVPL